MKPPYDLPAPISEEMPGYFEIEVSILPKEAPVHYFSNFRPTTTPIAATRWSSPSTAPAPRPSSRSIGGRATRATTAPAPARRPAAATSSWPPQWAADHQEKYRYSAREHALVLGCYRDACRRFAVDTDRVFLSGHSMGGDAAWDIGLAHPDLWAGVIPVVAESDRFCPFYRKNAKNLPFYFVCGELDGNKMTKNATDLDHYLRARLQHHRRRIPGPRPRTFLPTRSCGCSTGWAASIAISSPASSTCPDDAGIGQFFLVGGIGGDAPADHGQPGRLAAAPRHAARPSHRPHHRQQQPVDPDQGRQVGRLAGAGDVRFQAAYQHRVNGRKMNNHCSNLAPSMETLLEDVRRAATACIPSGRDSSVPPAG